MFTILFIAFLLTDLLLRQWLSMRQLRHVLQHRDQVPEQFSGRIGLQSHRRAADYTAARTRLSIAERFVEAAVLVAFTLLGGLQALDLQLGRMFEGEMLRQLMLIGSVLLIMGVIGLPFTVWRKFVIDERFGFNRMTPALFVADSIKTLFVVLLLGTPLAAAVLWIMGNTGTSWVWLAWVTWIVFKLLILWLFPTFIAPMFNKFTPLDQPELRERIEALARRCEFSLKGLFVMDGSRRSAHGNAYFTGFGKSRRIVFFDTLLNRLNVDEVEAVLAHELGHFKHKHILKRTITSAAMSLAFLLLLGWLSQQIWFYTGLGVIPQLGRPNDALALILFFMVIPVFTFWVTPLFSWMSRKDEYEADRFAVHHSSSTALTSALLKLYNDNASTLTPDPLHSAFYDSHPPAVKRLQALAHGTT
ncbi:MAG TPA: M48 family metallopeptidase [Burkholderiaceae bacterium]|nr:M48 family metallopeptidase [Burkholderiaceae bacterium]